MVGDCVDEGAFEFEALEMAENYRMSLLREFRPFLIGNVLEVGAGLGQFTRGILGIHGVEKLVALEPDARFCKTLRNKYPVLTVAEGTLEALQIEPHWDALVSINVLEHVSDDRAELLRFHHQLIRRRGHLCLFVPARPEVYSPIDRKFGHWRRYNKEGLENRLRDAGFHVLRLHYFNLVGYFAWYLNFCWLRKMHFNSSFVRWFDRFVFPVAHALERHLLWPPIGQSLLAVARAQ